MYIYIYIYIYICIDRYINIHMQQYVYIYIYIAGRTPRQPPGPRAPPLLPQEKARAAQRRSDKTYMIYIMIHLKLRIIILGKMRRSPPGEGSRGASEVSTCSAPVSLAPQNN